MGSINTDEKRVIVFKPLEECKEINKRYHYLNALIEYYAGRKFIIYPLIENESNPKKSIYILNDDNGQITLIEQFFIWLFEEKSNPGNILHTETRKYIRPNFNLGDMVRFKSLEECALIDLSISKGVMQQYSGSIYYIVDYKTDNEHILYKIQPYGQMLFIDDVPEYFLEILVENVDTDPRNGFKVIKFPSNNSNK